MHTPLNNDIREMLRAEGKLVTIKDDNQYVDLLGPIPLPRHVGDREVIFRWYIFTQAEGMSLATSINRRAEENILENTTLPSKAILVNSILCYGSFESNHSPLVRVHSSCLTGEVFGSLRCDCGPQLEEAFAEIVRLGQGAVVYMAGHEGRGIGLWAKGAAYLLQDRGYDTYQSNRMLGLADDCRDYAHAALILKYFLGPKAQIRLLTNNPAKVKALERLGIEILEQVTMPVNQNSFNRKYLMSKAERGHYFGGNSPTEEDDA